MARTLVFVHVLGLNNVALRSDHLFASSFTEFVAARAECTYQFGMGERIKSSLQHLESTVRTLTDEATLAARCANLRAAWSACVDLNLKDTKQVAEAGATLEELDAVKAVLVEGLSSLQLSSSQPVF